VAAEALGNAALEFGGAAEMPVTKLAQIGGSMPVRREREGRNGGWRRQVGVGVRGAAAAHL
jgi:hypothetical protein